ncbi:MAG: Asp-tRNA(Asn)/Glu-tRNA(Gln) amidotransferase GatCAB subunit A, partial [Treponema sp.]|nr:Asp-tRNA(Asn)/Glu-tRNA(Gln) amidotransferase GatCAB subunit A [Candidatus Treponema equi]
MTINETVNKLKNGETTSAALVKELMAAYEEDKKSSLPLNAFLEMFEDALTKAEAADKEIAEAKSAGTMDKL